ncbi:beta family protein [Dactylosporangium sp. NPDC050588]|uniref:beta family protein n=1 Tax=Dactylosporangium sp. NPDC050588 TaxID=3157211 RepID=UPI0033C0B041
MTMYVPILKARKGEFRAIAELAAPLAPLVMPVFEVVPTANGPGKDLWSFSLKVADSVPEGLLIAVDTHRLAVPLSGIHSPLDYVAHDLAAFGVPMLPVVHLTDPPAQLAVAAHAARLHLGRALVRLTGDPPEGPILAPGLPPEQCDLLLDMASVLSDRDLTRTEPLVRKYLAWAHRRPWRSITVAAGAMPAILPRHTPTEIPRWDLALWHRIEDPDVQYGDYGIAHPQTTNPRWRPSPNLRYTGDTTWQIYRSPDLDMYHLCRAVISSDTWPGTGFSWGDAEIAARAAGRPGPGNATNWRAWGTSHHLAHVVHQLTRR